MKDQTDGRVIAVSLSDSHSFSKATAESIRLLTGLGVEGDAHCGVLVKHRYRVKQDPTQPNLCQVHLLQAELFEELRGKGFAIAQGEMGENITTLGIDLLGLPSGALLSLGETAVVEVTGLRNPCVQMNQFRNRWRRGARGGRDPRGASGAALAGDGVRVRRA
jgi:MOSC domain-containing protein YiiM